MKNKAAFIYPVVILLLAAICSMVIYSVRTAGFGNWQTTDAVIVQRDTLHRHKHRVHFVYTVDGIQYTSSEVWRDNADRSPVGATTDVWYNPERPAQVSYGKPSPGFDASAPFFLAVPLSIAVFLFNRRGEQITKL